MESPRRSGSTRHDRSDRRDRDRPERVQAPSRGRSEDGSGRDGKGRGGRSTSRSRSPRRRSPSPGSQPAEERRRAKGTSGGRRARSPSRSRSRSPVEERSRSPSRERKRSGGRKREGGERRRSSAGGRSRSRSMDDSKAHERKEDSSRKSGRSSRQVGERTSARADDRGSSRRKASPPANGQANQQRRRSPSPPRRRRSPSPRPSNPVNRSDNSRPEYRRTRAVSSASEPAYRLSLSLPFSTLGSLLIGQSGWRAKEIKFYSGLTRLTFLAPSGTTASAELIGSKEAIKEGLWAIRKSIAELCISEGIGPKCGNVDEWAGYNEDRIEDLGASKAQVQRNLRPGTASASYAGGNRTMPAERSRPSQAPMDDRWNGPMRADGGWNGPGSRDSFRPDERRPGGSAAQLNSWGSRDTGNRFAAPNQRAQRPPIPERASVKSEEQIMDDELEALVQRRSPATDRNFSPVLPTFSGHELTTAASIIVPPIDALSTSTSLDADDLGRRVASLAPLEREAFVRRFLAASGVGIGVFALSGSSEQSLLQRGSTSAKFDKEDQAGTATSGAVAASLKRTSEEANESMNLGEDSSKRLRRTEEDAEEGFDMQE